MRETQETVGKWARDTFPGGDDLNPRHCLRLLEEVVELCLAAGASHSEVVFAASKAWNEEQSRKGAKSGFVESRPLPDKVPEEMADCAIVLDVLAERRGVDLQAAKDAKMAVNRARKWKANGDGTGYHIKEDSSDGE